jgi:hypothetical protein
MGGTQVSKEKSKERLIYEVWVFGEKSRQWFVQYWGSDKEYALKVRDDVKYGLGWPTAISWGTNRYIGKV